MLRLQIVSPELIEVCDTLDTLRTYVDAYGEKKSNSATGAILLAISNISIGFGVSLVVSNNPGPGWSSIIVGCSLVAAGIYFSFFKRKN